MTAGIEHTQQWAAADSELVGCEVEVAAMMTVAMLFARGGKIGWWAMQGEDAGACRGWRAANNMTRGGGG